MIRIGVQSKNILTDTAPETGFMMIRDAGFSCVDFSLNAYLKNQKIYKEQLNDFFDMTIGDLEHFFSPHKKAAIANGIVIHQMHMPYPIYVPYATAQMNQYLMEMNYMILMEKTITLKLSIMTEKNILKI